jgi:glycosyltransferase involved in cell wall biosynthesis
MKLLYVSNQRLPTEKAYGIQIASMCQAFAAQKVVVELVVPTRDARLGEDIFGYYKVPRTFTVHRCTAPDFYWPGPLDRVAVIIKQWIAAWKLVRYALTQKSDVIFTRDESVAYVASWFTRRVVFEAHTFSSRRAMLYRRLRDCGIRLVVISHALKREFERIGFLPELIQVAPDGVDLALFDTPLTRESARDGLDLPRNAKIVMYTGHLFAWKGAHVLAQTAKEIPEALFVFVGGMPGDIEAFRKQFGGQANIRIIGQRPHDEIPMYLKASDIVVLPNTSAEAISKSYTSPLKLFEYMAAQRPIIASDLPSLREVLNDENALLVPSDNPEALTQGIQRVLHDPKAQIRADRAYEQVQTMSWDARAQQIALFLKHRMVVFLAHDTHPHSGWGRFSADVIQGARASGYEAIILKEEEDGREGVAILRRGLKSFATAWRIRGYLRAADIIHALDINPYGIIAWLGTWLARRPLVITAVGSYSMASFQHSKTAWLATRAVRAADAVTAISRFTRDAVARFSGRDDIQVVTPGIDGAVFHQNHRAGEKKFILSVGALKYRKGYHIAIPAFTRVRQQIPDLEYIIVGSQRDQGYFEHLKQLAQDDQVSDVVHFLSDISDERLRDLYATASLFLLPSVNQGFHVEGFGIVFLEAAAAGLPVIGTQGNGIEDAVYNGYNGILVPQHDVERTAQAIIDILGNQEGWEKMSEASYAWARQHDLTQIRPEYDRIYDHFI